MKTTNSRIRVAVLLLIAIVLCAPTTLVGKAYAQNTGDDIAGEFRITITPEDTGDLVIRYDFLNYCAGIDYPDGPYTTGVPDREFDVLEWGSSNGVVTNAAPKITAEFQVALTLGHRPAKAECWDMYFVIRQHKIAYDNGDAGISLQFKNPYWSGQNDFFYAKKFNVIWVFGDKQPTKFDPEPTLKEATQAIYSWENVRLNSQFAVSMVWFSREALPNLDAANVRPEEPFTGGGEPQPTTSAPSEEVSLGTICVWACIIILVILIVLYIFWAIGRLSDGTPTTGHYHGSSSSTSIDPTIFLGEVAETLSEAADSIDLSGDGGGGGGGGGSSCACACAGCACACAGGGR